MGNGLLYLVVIGVIGILVFSSMGQNRGGEEMSLADFKKRVKSQELNARKVHNLVIGPTQMTWQDKSDEDILKGETAKRFYVGLWGIGGPVDP